MAITKRLVKGSPLTAQEFDGNLDEIEKNAEDINALQQSQNTSTVAYATFADLPVSGTTNVLYRITNDSTSSNNGYWTWDGASYVKAAETVVQVIDQNNTSDSVSGSAVYNHVQEHTTTAEYAAKVVILELNVEDKYINGSGVVSSNTNFTAQDYFAIDPKNKYYQTGRSVANFTRLAFRDSDNNFISRTVDTTDTTYSDDLIEGIPANAAYMAVLNANEEAPGHPYNLSISVEVYSPKPLTESVTELEQDIITENHDVRKTRLSIPIEVFTILIDGSTVSDKTVTIPSGVTSNQVLGSIIPLRQDIADKPPFLPLLDLVGKTVRIGFVLKATGNLDNFQPVNQGMVNTGYNILTNKVLTFDSQTGYIVGYADWVVGYTSGGAQTYISFNNDSASDTTVELIDFFYSVVDQNEKIIEKGISKYVIEEVLENHVDQSLIESTKAVLPTEIPVAQGVELSIYFDNLRKVDDQTERRLETYVTGYTGINKPNRFQYLRDVSDSLGVLGLNVDTIGFNGQVISTGGTLVRDVANNNGSGTLNTLVIGDSITEQAYWLLELLNLFKVASENGGANINLFGTSSCNPSNFEEIMTNDGSFSLPLYSEGRSSWNTADFLSAEKTTGLNQGLNPLWNPSRVGGADVDFINYLSDINALPRYQSPNNISSIDLVIILLGTNDLGLVLDDFISNIETLMDKVWRDYPNADILIGGIPPKAFGDDDKAQIVEWNERLNQEFYTPRNSPTGTGVSGLAQVNFWMDRINGYGRPAQSRVSGESALVTGQSGARYDQTHPFKAQLQMADAIFSAIQKILA